MRIRPLQVADMHRVMELKALCWPEELAGYSDNRIDVDREYTFWTKWMQSAEENNDVRLLYGAYDADELLGVAFGSFVESREAPEDGFELNGLWVYPKQRGQGVSLFLLIRLMDEFAALGVRKMIVYNYHHSSSNSYYRAMGCRLIDTETQLPEQVPVDIFAGDLAMLQKNIRQRLEKYPKVQNGTHCVQKDSICGG